MQLDESIGASASVDQIMVSVRRRMFLGLGIGAAATAVGVSIVGDAPRANAAVQPYNPWADYRITGTWREHAEYSQGGIDYPLAYGTDLVAPAAGTLRTSGGSGEFAAGWVGTAGRRSILILDTPINRVLAAESVPPEAAGPMVAIVVQHQAQFGSAGHKEVGEYIGKSGASVDGNDNGGDTHLHVHGLDAQGRRVDMTKFITNTVGNVPVSPIETITMEDDDMAMAVVCEETGAASDKWIAIFGGGLLYQEIAPSNRGYWNVFQSSMNKILAQRKANYSFEAVRVTQAEYTNIKSAFEKMR
ncbi:hypothetical protein [Rathayibacter tritici]|uniref:hypothetical protein n=1 Tax=Rathayibacter tritici TaxID=33888 RepID=UPI0011B0C41C|nr:hypothetical protein [Rathayibacter tritici]